MRKLGVLVLLWSASILLPNHNRWLTEAAPANSAVTHLPGFTAGDFPSKHHSGYINIDGGSSGKRLFYYFVTSQRSPAADPVVLWLNGGPGCSSFDGFVYEHGPFNFGEGNPKGTLPTLHLNPYSWSKVSNIIYLDSPAGVGLSYSPNEANYNTGDLQTASDTHIFLLRWFEEFPEFLQNPFYIAGESFAGIYVPTLASQVVQGLKNGAVPIINFKGYMVGNGVTDEKFDGNALVPFAHGMALISDAMFQRFTFGIWAPHWHLCQPSCRCPSRQNWLLRPNVATLPAALLAKIGSFAQCDDSSGFNIVFVPCSRFPLLLLGV